MRVCLLVATLAALACRRDEGAAQVDPSQVLARVDDEVITVADLERHIARQDPFVRARYAQLDRRKELLENLVRIEVLAKEAQKRGYDRDPDVVRFVKQQMIEQLVRREVDDEEKIEDIPEADAQRYYQEHLDEFRQPEQVRVSQILTKARTRAVEAAAAAKALRRDDDRGFRALVAKFSEDEDSKTRGGDLTFMDRLAARYPRPVVDAAFALGEVGEISDVVASDQGHHVLRLTEKRRAFTRPFPEVKRQIQTRLYGELRAKRLAGMIDEMRGRLKVEIYEDKLKDVAVTAEKVVP